MALKRKTSYAGRILLMLLLAASFQLFGLGTADAVGPGTIQFSTANYATDETAGTVTLELQRVGGDQGQITVDIQTHDGTATIVDDYAGIPTPLTLTWSDGNSDPKTIKLPIAPDALAEPDETFTMTITSTNPSWVGTPNEATVTITDNPPGTIQFSTANYTTDETAGTVTLELQRVGGNQGQITVDIQTHDGTATIVDDYAGIPTPLTLTWSDGNSDPKTIKLPIAPDALAEPDETFTMTITSTNPSWVGTPNEATVTITDNPPGTIQFSTANYTVNEADGTIEIQVERIGGSAGAASAEVSTGAGTATAATDYTAIPDVAPVVLTWADGDNSTQTISIPIIDDGITEPDETFTAKILSTTGAGLGTPAETTVTISDAAPPAPTPTPSPTTTPDPGSTPTPTPIPTPIPRPAGEISFVAPGYTTTEQSGEVVIEIQRTNGHHGEVSALIATSSSSAVAGDDYSPIVAAIPTKISWADGESGVKTITIPILTDGVSEADETFSLQIISTTGASAPYATGSTTIVITETPVEKPPASQASDPTDETSTAAVRKVTTGTKQIVATKRGDHMRHMNDASREFSILDSLAGEEPAHTSNGFAVALLLLIPLGIGTMAFRTRTTPQGRP